MALPPDARARLTTELELAFDVVVDRSALPFTGAVRPATVVFAGPAMVVARLDGGGNVTLRWRSSGLERGERVGVSTSAHGHPLVAERQRADGEVERVELELATAGTESHDSR